MRFNVTYEIVTQESAEYGDSEESGFIGQKLTLRDAIAELFSTRTSAVNGIECFDPSDSDIESARWFTVYNGMEYATGANESRSIHLPDSISGASRKRLFNLLKGI